MKSKVSTIVVSFSLICFFGWSQRAKAGAHVGNGGGTSEKYILQSYYHLGSYISLCLSSPYCNLSPKERNVLTEIKNSLPEEYKNSHQIQFLSGSRYQSFFTINGLIRNAVTGNRVGDLIYINVSQLYSAKGRPISLGFAIATLIHEMAHHHGIKDSASDLPDLLGEKVERVFEGATLTTQTYLSPQRTILSAIYYDGDHELLFSDASNFLDATHEFLVQIRDACSTRGVAHFRLDGLTWGLGHWSAATKSALIPLSATVDVICNNRQNRIYSLNVVFWLEVRLKKYAPFFFHDHLEIQSVKRSRIWN